MLACLLALILSPYAYSQTCNDKIVKSAPDERFINNDDETVSDIKTGLMWQQCVAGTSGMACSPGTGRTKTWDTALQYPETLNSSGGFSGYTDWRLPNIKELESLIEVACYGPAANNIAFSAFGNRVWFWSSSPATWASSWGILFDTGRTIRSSRSALGYVRLVRDI